MLITRQQLRDHWDSLSDEEKAAAEADRLRQIEEDLALEEYYRQEHERQMNTPAPPGSPRKLMAASDKVAFRVRLASRPKMPILWWENEAGDRWIQPFGPGEIESPPPGYIYQWSRFPTVLREHVLRMVVQEEVDACPHPAESIKPDLGIIDSMEGRECEKCHGYQSKNKGEPWPEKWEANGSRDFMATESTWSPDLVLAMVRPSEDELAVAVQRHGEEPRLLGMDDAILMAATSCERCLNALLWRYGCNDGYPPYSEQWDKSNTRCGICKTPGVWSWLLNERPVAFAKTAVIRKEKGQYCVRSPNNPDWNGGCYDTKEEAEKRLQQVEFFKRQANGGHYTELCRECGAVISQCRCMSPDKEIRYGLCDACAGKQQPVGEPAIWHRITTVEELQELGRTADPAMLAEVQARSKAMSDRILAEIRTKQASGSDHTASLITPNQLKYIRLLLKQRGFAEPPNLEKWTALNASKLIGNLQDRRYKPAYAPDGRIVGWDPVKKVASEVDPLSQRVADRYLETKLSPHQRGWEKRKEKDDFTEMNIPPEHLALWRKLKNQFKGTPDQRAEQFMEYVEAHPGESDAVLQEKADREIAKLQREQDKQRREQVKLEKECDKRQTKYEDAWYKEQERATKEKRNLEHLKQQAEGICRICPTCHGFEGDEPEMVPFAASASQRVAARYKEKKKITNQKGEKTTVYLYSEQQIARRNADKAKRLEKLRKSIGNLRTKVKRDLKSSDPERYLTALAVALIDHTYERVGNEESAKDRKHYGVTGWRKRHISFGKGQATIKYTGKSGVQQHKKVTDKAILTALRNAYEACSDDDGGIFDHDDIGKVTAEKINSYLEPFEVSAKDLRGFHANREMQERLSATRSKGGKLPEDKKAREKQLKEEFKQALEEAAEAVGHEPSTLRSQYLVPGLEEAFLKDGTVPSKMKIAAEGAYTYDRT